MSSNFKVSFCPLTTSPLRTGTVLVDLMFTSSDVSVAAIQFPKINIPLNLDYLHAELCNKLRRFGVSLSNKIFTFHTCSFILEVPVLSLFTHAVAMLEKMQHLWIPAAIKLNRRRKRWNVLFLQYYCFHLHLGIFPWQVTWSWGGTFKVQITGLEVGECILFLFESIGCTLSFCLSGFLNGASICAHQCNLYEMVIIHCV